MDRCAIASSRTSNDEQCWLPGFVDSVSKRELRVGAMTFSHLQNLGQVWPFKRLRVDWFEAWHPDLDAAQRLLPEMETCPPELYKELIELRDERPKRTALVTEGGNPVAVIGLKYESSGWRPVTTWLVPEAVFPAANEYLLAALAALRIPVFVAWWRQRVPPPAAGFLIDHIHATPTHHLSCAAGFEAYWRQSGLERDIARARKKCAHLRFEVNMVGADEWAITNWAKRWSTPGSSHFAESIERIAVSRYWTKRGRQFTFALLDGDRLAAADVCFAHRGDIVGQIHYRDPAFEKYSVGTRLIEGVHRWAAESGFAGQDFGGGHAYKKRWAPESGIRWEFTLRRDPLRPSRIAKALWRSGRRAVA